MKLRANALAYKGEESWLALLFMDAPKRQPLMLNGLWIRE